MASEKEIISNLASVLDAYKEQIGCGLFTRRSRKVMVKELENLLERELIAEVINQVLTFSWSMQGENADVGFFGQSKLHSMLWGNDAPHINVYQRIFDYLKNLNKKDPQNEIFAQIIFPGDLLNDNHKEEKSTPLQKLTNCFRATEKNSKVLSQYDDLQKKLLDQEPTFLQKLMRCIGFNWTKNCSLRIR